MKLRLGVPIRVTNGDQIPAIARELSQINWLPVQGAAFRACRARSDKCLFSESVRMF